MNRTPALVRIFLCANVSAIVYKFFENKTKYLVEVGHLYEPPENMHIRAKNPEEAAARALKKFRSGAPYQDYRKKSYQ